MVKVLICDAIANEAIEKMQNAGLDVTVKIGMDKSELLKVIPDYDVAVVRSATKITREVIEAGKNLKLVYRGGVGLDNIDRVAAKEHGIEVMNTPGASSISVAELAIGYMFALSRKIPQATASTKSGKWDKKSFKGNEIFGKTLALLGLGRIGTETAKRAKALGMKVIAYDPYVKQSPLPELNLVSLDNALKQADYISLHMPLTDETHHIINKEKFKLMKTGVRIVQCARGGILDEKALYDAIKDGKVAGAAIDVYESEPAKENALFELDEIICSPHIGANTAEGQLRVGIELAEGIIERFAQYQS